MKKVVAFVGSAHKKNTQRAVVQFLNELQALGGLNCEIVTLSDYRLEVCRGCGLCFQKGEEFCPLKDDRDELMDKIMSADGIVMATPNYSFQVSGMMKVFLDRFGFALHRPRYFGKAFTSIVSQGIGGGDKIVDYLDFLGRNLGFNTVKGACITALDPISDKDRQKMDSTLAQLSKQFHAKLSKPAYPVPTFFQLLVFRIGRTTIAQMLDDRSRDYRYYVEKGWLDSDYYYPTRMGAMKKAAGRIFDAMAPALLKMLA
jgi:multimeric flavodoxin WrbA